MTTTHSTAPNRRTAAAAALLFGLGSIAGVAACSDEDGDGGETDEEIEDVEDEVNEEVDAQDEGSDEG